MGSTHLVIDGSNIATEGRSLPSLSQLLGAVDAAKADLGADVVTVIVDATFGHRIEEHEHDAFEDKISSGEIIIPPAGVIGRGDAFILEVADRVDAVVLSNDSFQEFHGQYRWLFEEGRLLGGKHVPGVGWIFLARSPVRGAVSRKAIADSKKKQGDAKAGKQAKEPRQRSKKVAIKSAKKQAKKSTDGAGKRQKAAPKAKASPKVGNEPAPYNDPLPFIEFVGAHPVGSTVEATVEQFSSHGAYVMVGETRCYVPLRALADPAPRSARDVLEQDETRTFLVEAIDTPRRGVDLRLVTDGEPVRLAPPRAPKEERRPAEPETKPDEPEEHLVTDAEVDDESLSVSQRRRLRAQLAAQEAASADNGDTPAEPAAESPTGRSRSRRGAARSAADEAPAKKAPAKKAPAKKAPAKKAPAKKAPAKKAPAKKTPAKKAPAKKAPAKKAPAKKAPAKKAPAKKAPAKKST